MTWWIESNMKGAASADTSRKNQSKRWRSAVNATWQDGGASWCLTESTSERTYVCASVELSTGTFFIWGSYQYLHRGHVIEGVVQFLTDGFVLEFLCIKLVCIFTHTTNKGVFKVKRRRTERLKWVMWEK